MGFFFTDALHHVSQIGLSVLGNPREGLHWLRLARRSVSTMLLRWVSPARALTREVAEEIATLPHRVPLKILFWQVSGA